MSARPGTRRPDWRRGGASVLLLALVLFVQIGCGEADPDAGQALKIVDDVTGWFDVGIVEGQNKIVPTVSFKIQNIASRPIHSVQLNAVFRIVGDEEELGSMLLKGIDSSGLAANAAAGPFVARSNIGYTGQEPRNQMLQNRHFRDAQVEIFAKQGGKQWVKLGTFKIARQLLTT